MGLLVRLVHIVAKLARQGGPVEKFGGPYPAHALLINVYSKIVQMLISVAKCLIVTGNGH